MSSEKIYEDEATQWLQSLQPNNKLSEGFKLQLKERILSEMDHKKRPLSIFGTIGFKLAGSVFVVSLIVAGIQLANQPDIRQLTVTDPNLRKTILANALKNNSGELRNQFTATSEESSSKDLAQNEPSPKLGMMDAMFFPQYAYMHNKSTYTLGPKQDSCLAKDYWGSTLNGTTTESHNYYDDEKYMSKTITTGSDGNIIEYYLTVDNKSYEYRGGQYAVVTTFPEFDIKPMLETDTVSDVVDDKSSIDLQPNEPTTTSPSAPGQADAEKPQIDDTTTDNTQVTPDVVSDPSWFYGDNATVEEIVEDGKTVGYIVTSNYPQYCSNGDTEVNTFVKTWLSADQYTIEREEHYEGSVSPENLMISIVYYNETADDLSQADQERIFTFDLDVELRQFTYPEFSYDKYRSDVKNYLANQDIIIALPTSDFDVNYISSFEVDKLQSPSYLYDRNFYPEGEYGDKIYNQYNGTYDNTYIQPMVRFSLMTKDNATYGEVLLFEGDIDNDLAAKSTAYNYADDEILSKTDTTLTLGGNTISAKKYEINNSVTDVAESASSLSVSTTGSGEDVIVAPGEKVAELLPMVVYVFKFNGDTYTYKADTYDSDNTVVFSTLVWKTYDTSNNTSLNAVMKLWVEQDELRGGVAIMEGASGNSVVVKGTESN